MGAQTSHYDKVILESRIKLAGLLQQPSACRSSNENQAAQRYQAHFGKHVEGCPLPLMKLDLLTKGNAFRKRPWRKILVYAPRPQSRARSRFDASQGSVG